MPWMGKHSACCLLLSPHCYLDTGPAGLPRAYWPASNGAETVADRSSYLALIWP